MGTTDLQLQRTTWMKLTDVTLSERSQAQTSPCCMIPFAKHSKSIKPNPGCEKSLRAGDSAWKGTGRKLLGAGNVVSLSGGYTHRCVFNVQKFHLYTYDAHTFLYKCQFRSFNLN